MQKEKSKNLKLEQEQGKVEKEVLKYRYTKQCSRCLHDSPSLARKKKQVGDTFFCSQHREEWRSCLMLLEIDDLPCLPDLVPESVLVTYVKHGEHKTAYAFTTIARQVGYNCYVELLVACAEKKLFRGSG